MMHHVYLGISRCFGDQYFFNQKMTVLCGLDPYLEMTQVQQNIINYIDAFDNIKVTSRGRCGACRPSIYLPHLLYTQLPLCSIPHSSMALIVFFISKNVTE